MVLDDLDKAGEAASAAGLSQADAVARDADSASMTLQERLLRVVLSEQRLVRESRLGGADTMSDQQPILPAEVAAWVTGNPELIHRWMTEPSFRRGAILTPHPLTFP